MITALIDIGCLVIYLMIGMLLGRCDVPYFIADQRRRYPALHDPDYDRYMDTPELKMERTKSIYPAAVGWWVLWVLFWPLMFLVTRIKRGLTGGLLRQIERIDPKAADVRMATMQQRIDELEYELEIDNN